MSDRTSDGRPPRKAGAGTFRGDKPYRGKPDGRKSFGNKAGGGKSGDRPGGGDFERKPRGATSGERPATGRNRSDAKGSRSFGGKPGGGKSFGGKSAGGKSFGGKPSGGRPYASRPRPERDGEAGTERKTFGARTFSEGGEERSAPAPRKDFGDRPPRRDFGDRPPRKDFGDRPPRKDFGDRPPRRDFGDRPPRKDFGDRPPRRDFGDRPPRRDFGDRPPRRDFGDRPPRRDAAEGRGFVRRDDTRTSPAPQDAAGEAQTRAATVTGGRIAKVIARAGACSRRDAEVWITEGRVAVNGTVLDSPAFNVGPDDKITIDGKPLANRERTRLFMFHKPRGLVTTNSDPEGRSTIFDALPDDVPRLVSVGRLDINTEGLMLLTNDGGLARVLELPATGWLRRYRVRAHGETDQAQLDKLMDGVTVDGIDYRGIDAKIDRTQGANLWLTIGLREGKNREVKRVLESLGLEVNRLIRISYGPFQLGELGEGALDEVPTRILKDQLGERLAEEAGADFDAPVIDRNERDEPRYEVEATGRGGSFEPRRERTGRGEESEERRPGTEPPGKRKHVSALRDISNEKKRAGPRLRIEQSATADRKGRTINVERRVPPVRGEEEIPDSRNARRFASERGERPPRREWNEDERPQRGRGPGRPERASFEPRTRPPREEGSERAPREDGPKTYAARSSGPRKNYRDDRGGSGGRERSEAPRGRSFGDRPAGDRPAGGRSYGDRPSGGRSFGGKPFGGKPFGDRPSGDRPSGGRSFSRPSGDRPQRDRPQRDRPQGDRPYGDRPQSDRPQGDRPARKSFGDKPGGKRFSPGGPRSDAGRGPRDGKGGGPRGGKGGFKSGGAGGGPRSGGDRPPRRPRSP